MELCRECICQAHLGSPTFTLFRAKLIQVLNSQEILQCMRYEIENDKIATNGGLQQQLSEMLGDIAVQKDT